jgi:hypothetical protein
MKISFANIVKKATAGVLAASFCLALASCDKGETTKTIPSDYGSYGACIARELAAL